MTPELEILLRELEKEFPLTIRRVRLEIKKMHDQEERNYREAMDAIFDPWGDS